MKVIAYAAAAIRQMRKLPPPLRERIIAKMKRYAQTGAGDVKVMAGQPGARLRIGDWRVIFVETETEIEVRAVGHRREIYE